MIMKFEEWLTSQQNREDMIGNFARILDVEDVRQKFSRRKLDEHKNWADVVIGIAQPGYVDVFNEAWQEFLVAKQVAEDARVE
jgi:ABC-type thiamine transport system substrate-binding protein